MAYAADWLLNNPNGQKPFAIDINMGCPVKKIVTSGDGSALMRTPEIAKDVVKAVLKIAEKYNVPLWVKIRAGWDKNSINAP
ncbi:MAG: tRNA-dihydrouridine synthase, partial [Fibrobacter sp.]|nr:tRNA-dihydrouridine synthase [Fibrobacter sp.]